MNKLASINPKERIESLDLLRGFALLGILIMNITSFSNIGTGYINPTLGAGLEGYNGLFHGFGYLFADMRFMSIFSMLFGAGLLIFSDNAVKKGIKAGKYHYRRMFLLILFGFIHAYLIWMGDILVMYAICGSIVYLMRNWSQKRLLVVGGIIFIIPILFSMATYYYTPQEQLQEIFSFWTPTQEEIESETIAYQGSYFDQMEPRIAGAIEIQTLSFLTQSLWRILSMMMLGMILFRSGILSANKEDGFYQRLFIIGLSSGVAISTLGLYFSYSRGWEGIWYMNIGFIYTYLASVAVALGYVGLIMLWSKTSILTGIQARLKAIGKLAFTNYILTSIICTTIFYGHGLGLFGSMDRLEQWGVVLIVWIILLFISPIILKKYDKGPLEYIWRKFTYL